MNINSIIKNTMPQDFTILSGSGVYTSGGWTGLYAYNDVTFGTGSICNGSAKDLSFATFSAGQTLLGNWTRVEIVSGSILGFLPVAGV